MKKLMMAAVLLTAAWQAEAKLTLATPFADGMVLQRDMKVPVWGWADAGEKITVVFGGQKLTAVADAEGRWRVDLAPMPASTEGRTLTASAWNGHNAKWSNCWGLFAACEEGDLVEVKDVLVGEVWYCAGQSNTELPLCGTSPHFRDRKGAMRAMLTRKPNIRFAYCSNYRCAVDPKAKADYKVEWKKFMPPALLGKDGGRSFSAMGVHFALELYSALDIPVGIVGSYWGGTRIEPWTPREGFAMTKGCDAEAAYRADVKNYKPELMAKMPNPSSRVQDQPSVLWNEMVAPWAPFALRGFIWYQGCSNARQHERYAMLMHALYNGWSRHFENPDLKLAFVQLAPWGNDTIPYIQEAQAVFAAEEKNARMAIINDIANLKDIHPYDKETVGQRLAALVLKHDYGFADIVADAPEFAGGRVDGAKAILSFRNAEQLYLYNPDFGIENGFELAGADGQFKPAKLVNLQPRRNGGKTDASRSLGLFSGRDIVLQADGVAQPTQVRYLYSSPWYGGIHNEGNMPLGAFHAQLGK